MTLRARLHTLLWDVGIQHNHILVLSCPLGSPPPAPPGLELEEVGPNDPRVPELGGALDRGLTEAAIEARRRQGMRFLVLRSPEREVATTWVLTAGERFLEELGVGFAVPTGALWLRDLFVVPAERGRGRFGDLLDAIRVRWPDRSAFWSDIRHGNRPSRRAHRTYGFEVASRYEVVHLFSRVLVRLRWPPDPLPSEVFGRGGRWTRTGEAYQRLADAHRA